MHFEDRWYQIECVEALEKDIVFSETIDKHPIAVVPTGAGKSVILCKLVERFVDRYPHKDVLVLSHVSEILEQNYAKLDAYFGDTFLGLFSASLDRKEKNKITVAGIQSIFRRAKDFQNVGLVIIDECHLINSEDQGMYRKFLNKLHAVYCGLTATPFRTGQGYIYKDYSKLKGRKIKTLFNKLSYDLSSYENYNRLIDEGFLVDLIPAPTDFKMDVSDVEKVKGDFDLEGLSLKFNREGVTDRITDEIIKYAKSKYKKWLLFAIDVEHAKSIKENLLRKGVSCEAVYSGMETPKSEVLADFRSGKLKAVVNVNMLTTGLDIPDIDLIAHLRATESPIYHVQTNGRGTRPAPGKTHCLVLDFAGNTARHGPINAVRIVEPTPKGKGGEAPPTSKACENCGTLNAIQARACVACDEEFPINHNLQINPDGSVLVKKKVLEKWCKVKSVSYGIHRKAGSPPSIRVMYDCGYITFSEWIAIEGKGYPKRKAIKWITNRWESDKKIPATVQDFLNAVPNIKEPGAILVNTDNKYPEIKDFDFNDPPKKLSVFSEITKDKLPGFVKNKVDCFDDDIPF